MNLKMRPTIIPPMDSMTSVEQMEKDNRTVDETEERQFWKDCCIACTRHVSTDLCNPAEYADNMLKEFRKRWRSSENK